MKKISAFLYPLTFTIIIYLTIPFARSISNILQARNLLINTIYTLITFFIIISCYLILRYAGYRLLNIIFLIIYFGVYLSIVQSYEVIVERIHFIEYGILTYLLFNSFKKITEGFKLYFASFFTYTLIGWGDEVIQYFLPERVYDLRDVFLNCLSGSLILLLIFLVEVLKGKTSRGTPMPQSTISQPRAGKKLPKNFYKK